MGNNNNVAPLGVNKYDSGSWVDKDAAFDYKTTNRRELPAREVQPFERASQANKKSLELGNQGNNYST
jgi:hypothetical protein